MRKEYNDRKNDTTASRVRVLREKNGLTQQELADKIGVTNSQISRLESGKTKNISSFILVALADLFHVSVDYLLCIVCYWTATKLSRKSLSARRGS